MNKFVSVALVGKLNQDTVGDAPDQPRLADAKHRAASPIRIEIGGASANISRAIGILAEIYGDDCSTKIITRVGKAPRIEQFEDDFGDTKFGEFLAAKNAYDNAFEILRYYGVSFVDVSAREEGPGVAASMVANYGGHIQGKSGRAIVTDPDVPESELCQNEADVYVRQGLSEGFNNVVHNLMQHVKPMVRNELKDSAHIFIDPSRVFDAYVGASVCIEHDISYIVDYGKTKWPKNPRTVEMLSAVLKHAAVLIVPDDAVVEGMEDYVRNPQLLYDKIRGKDYAARTIIMSNGTESVLVTHDNKEYDITVEPARQAINKNGVGDTRDGALIFFLARGDDMLTAADKATAVATIRVQYPGTEWKDHFIEEVMANPRFKWLFEGDLPELKCMRSKAIEKFDVESLKKGSCEVPLDTIVKPKSDYALVPVSTRGSASVSDSDLSGDLGRSSPEPD